MQPLASLWFSDKVSAALDKSATQNIVESQARVTQGELNSSHERISHDMYPYTSSSLPDGFPDSSLAVVYIATIKGKLEIDSRSYDSS